MITIIGTADMDSTAIIQRADHAIQMVNRAIQAWRRSVSAVQYNLFDPPASYYDPKEIACLFELYIRECGLRCTGIRQPLRLTTNCALRPKRIDQWDYG